jgi:hypothetical protein
LSRRALRFVALGYLVKTLILGAAWALFPDLPQKAWAKIQQTLQLAE